MNYKIYFLCLLIVGCVFADGDVTEKPTDAPATEETKAEETTQDGVKADSTTPVIDAETKNDSGEKKDQTTEASASAATESSGESSSQPPADGGITNADTGSEETGKTKEPVVDKVNSVENTKEITKTPENVDSQPRELKTPAEVTPQNAESLETSTKKREVIDAYTKKIPVEATPSEISKVVGDVSTDNPGNSAQHVDVPPKSTYTAGMPKPPADHKMTPTEQKAFICNLPILEGDLCPMTINLEENVGISDPGANAYCNDVIAAPMGYHGFCVVLMKSDPKTGTPVYTRTCAYYDKERTKCSTNFLTTEAVTNSSQVKYACNGITHYIPTSCVKKQKALTLE